MKELLLGLECGWAHLHHIGVLKPVTSKITQESTLGQSPQQQAEVCMVTRRFSQRLAAS